MICILSRESICANKPQVIHTHHLQSSQFASSMWQKKNERGQLKDDEKTQS
jgi:hypothetical protein